MYLASLKHLISRSVLLGCLTLFGLATSAFANIDQSMTAQFNAMINTTPAGVYETQASKVISGGGFVYRPRVAQLRLLAIDPPRLRADCNGIDAYAGSLSFISKEAFINFLRNLAAAAPAYAFNMALSYLCKDCDQHLARLQKLAQDVNGLTINSCKIDAGQMAKQVRTIANDIDDIVGNEKTLGNYFAGLSTDYFGPRQEPGAAPKRLNDAAAAGNADAQAVVAEVNVNIAKATADRAALADWWGATLAAADKRRYDEVMMSFTGSIVTKPVAPSDDAGAEKDQTYYLPPLLKFTDFLYGGSRDIYSCPTTECLITPDDAKVAYTLPSFRQKVEDLLIGTTTAPGIIYKLNARASRAGAALSNAEKTFVSGLPGGVYAHLRELAIYPSAAETYARTLSTWLAAEMAYEYLSQTIRNARISADKSKAKLLQKEWLAELDKIEIQISEDRARFSDTLKAQGANLNIAQMMRENLSRATAVGLRPNAFGPSN